MQNQSIQYNRQERVHRDNYSDLDLPECLFIKSIRLWLHGSENWSLVGMQYQAHFGPGAASIAMLALKGIIEIINAGARRDLLFQKVWSAQTTGDERTLIALIAACQAGDRGRTEALAQWLVKPPLQLLLVSQMDVLGTAFRKKGHGFVHLSPRRPLARQPAHQRGHQQALSPEEFLDAGD